MLKVADICQQLDMLKCISNFSHKKLAGLLYAVFVYYLPLLV